MKTKLSNQKGFTIIEVLIVLAIAGLIMLIVFLAVPALQRNSRNSQRKTDVGRIGSAAQEVLSNNNGDISKVTGPTVQAQVGTLSYYDKTKVTQAATPAANATSSDVDSVVIYTKSKCFDAQTVDKNAGNSRSIAILYAVESGTTTTSQCIDQ